MLIAYLEAASPRWFRWEEREKRRGKMQCNVMQYHLLTTDHLAMICRDTTSHLAGMFTWHKGLLGNCLQEVTNHPREVQGREKWQLTVYLPSSLLFPVTSDLIKVPQSPPSDPSGPIEEARACALPEKPNAEIKGCCHAGGAQHLGCECQTDPGPQLRLQKAKDLVKVAASGGRWLFQKKEGDSRTLRSDIKAYVQNKCLATS